MWESNFNISIGVMLLAIILSLVAARIGKKKKKRANVFIMLFAGVLISAFFMFIPIYGALTESTNLGNARVMLLSLFTSMQIFTIGTEYQLIMDSMGYCPDYLSGAYQLWVSILFALAPVFTFGFVMSLFKNIWASIRLWFGFFRDVYVFSELNENSIALATDIKAKNKRAQLVFTDVFEENDEQSFELAEKARNLGTICFKKDLLAINFKFRIPGKHVYFFTMGADESENLDQAIVLIENYKKRKNTHLYAFSNGVESELLLNSVDKGKIRVVRVNPVRSLVNRILYENGEILFERANAEKDGVRDISAVVIGMGRHGKEMIRALAWFGQMDGYSIHVDAFDKDPLAEDKFTALVPELMSEKYNGVLVEGEAQYTITIHPNMDVETATFAKAVQELKNTTYVLVALGSDEANINTAVNLRMLFERIKIHPVIQAIVYNTHQKKALTGIRNYRGQEYDIDFIGDTESCYCEAVIMGSELEADALQRHLKWGKEPEFWNYEYNYRSSSASAIHMKNRIKVGIPGADKQESELTQEERDNLEILEHRRWNAYMRSEGYVFSGSTDKSSRNDLAKMHHDLVDFESLSEEDKRKDSRVGSH